MKMLFLIFFILFFSFRSIAQNGVENEKKYELIYDSFDLQKIIPQVDSLNTTFSKKSFPGYYALKQARAIYLNLDHLTCREAADDLENNMSLEQFLRKYPKTEVKRNVLVIQELRSSYRDQPEMDFTCIDPLNDNSYWDLDINEIETLPSDYKGKIIFKYYDGYDPSDASLVAFYFLENFTSPKISSNYAGIICYNKTIFDSAITVYTSPHGAQYQYSPNYPSQKKDPRQLAVDTFLSIVKNKFSLGFTTDCNYYLEDEIKKSVDAEKLDSIRNWVASSAFRQSALNAAIDSAASNHYSNNLFEYLIGNLTSLNTELAVKRGRLPNRSCGNDMAPKIQDYTIADLALKTGNLKLFLSAHNYVIRGGAGGEIRKGNVRRGSYISELDFIHIDPEKYFIGSYLSTAGNNNSYLNEYDKYLELYDFKDRSKIEALILEGIADNQLDNFNRLCLTKLFARYCCKEADEEKKKKNISRLNFAVSKLPACIRFDYANYIKNIEIN